MNQDLSDDKLKLVRYKILFIKRDLEFAFPEREELVPDNLDGAAFTGWKVAEFVNDLASGETPIPDRWAKQKYPPPGYVEAGKLKGLPEEDKKYLRIYYEVLERYEREEFSYDESQINVLKEIRKRLATTDEGRDD